ncbi:glycosyltransferase [Planotetraspora sp. GP83]|uniref:glycosyltransferase family 2 protein n=1 Tax=Planotetraspora sp. GP83 TaxID=3156264 RepID=UPI003512A546
MISIVIVSKDEPALDKTLAGVTAQARALAEQRGAACEIIVVDASEGRLDHIAAAHPHVRWKDFRRPPGVRVSIPHQRNEGVRSAEGEVIVFTDAGCLPEEGWLATLLRPILTDYEAVTAGVAVGPRHHEGLYDDTMRRRTHVTYLDECPTINLAFRREAYEAVGGFDEAFEYGSDVDFSWRLIDAGHRIRNVPTATVIHDWGDGRRQLRRSYVYGKARARLYRKHRARRGQLLRKEPMVLAYPLFLLGLPLTFVFPLYPALLLIPIVRNRHNGPIRVVVDHLAYGVGVLAELTGR